MSEGHNSAVIDKGAKKSWRYWPVRVESLSLRAMERAAAKM